jgi:hypothetical protein
LYLPEVSTLANYSLTASPEFFYKCRFLHLPLTAKLSETSLMSRAEVRIYKLKCCTYSLSERNNQTEEERNETEKNRQANKK